MHFSIYSQSTLMTVNIGKEHNYNTIKCQIGAANCMANAKLVP